MCAAVKHNALKFPNGIGAAEEAAAGVVLRGVFYGGSGYADEMRGIAFGMCRTELPVQIETTEFNHDVGNLLTPGERQTLELLKLQRLELSRSVLFQNFPAHDFDLYTRARYRVGRTMYETDNIPDGWVHYCEAMDEVWVPSEFNRRTFAAAGVSEKKLRVLPEGVDTQRFRPGLEPFPLPQRRGFNFLSVFEWIQRKGPDILLRAYLSEFKADEDVSLILKAYGRPDPSVEMLPRLAYFVERVMGLRLEDTPPIIVLAPGFMPGADIPRLYATADAFVLPTRGEGWGRPYMEALACEVPVIATRWSGQMDFLHEDIGYLLDAEIVPVPWDIDVELSAGHRCAEPSVDQLRQLMRHVFTHREEAQRLARRGRAEMVEKWDWNVVVQQRWVPEFRRLLD